MAINFPNLPFELTALEPHISRKTLEFHYGKHHRHYVDTLNELIKGTALDRADLVAIMNASCEKNPEIYDNAAQAWNHDFLWHSMTNSGKSPSAELERTIGKTFGSLNDFKGKFSKEAKELFGSGWVWLTKDRKGRLQIRATQNAENPMQDAEVPLFTCDVWEHAYYLDYQNERPKFLENFWSIVNWEFIESNLESPVQSGHERPGSHP